MNYYKLKPSLLNDPQISVDNKNELNRIWQETDAINCHTNLISSDEVLPYLEITAMYNRYFLVSSEMFNIFIRHDNNLLNRPAALQSLDNRVVARKFVKPISVSCIHSSTTFKGDIISELILDKKRCNNVPIFLIEHYMQKILICNEIILEQLLFQGIYPFDFFKIDCE